MMDYVLEITLQSPLTAGSGERRIGIADREVVFDDLGLPILPGRRLKGLWREAYRDVVEAWHQILSTDKSCRIGWPEAYRNVVEGWISNGELPVSVKSIFGKPGGSPEKGNACFYVANAELQEASSLKEWLQYLQHSDRQWQLQSEDVQQHFATVRAQTAMDRWTGAARDDTLRLTRTLRPDLVFHAPVQFSETPSDSVLSALALGAAALQHMGVSRSRGLGKVRCRFIRERDVTAYALSQHPLPSINVVNTKSSSPTSIGRTSSCPRSSNVPSTHILRYRLALTAPTVIPVSEGDPNTVVTRRYIPGTHIWGVAAWHYLHPLKHKSTDLEFRQAFLDAGLRFLSAYPENIDDKPQQRLIPLPHSVRQLKDDEGLVDLAKKTCKDPIKRLEYRYARIRLQTLKTQLVKIERNYHHARSKDRRKGRALKTDGAIYRYEAIQANQTFQGAVLGSEENLRKLKEEWLGPVDVIRLGRSRSAQYGSAKFEWIDDTPQELDKISSEWDGFVETKDDHLQIMPPSLDKCLIIIVLSPLLSVNRYGHPDTRFPEYELAQALQLPVKKLKLLRSYTRTEVLGGYDVYLRLPRQQWPAIAAGSVFVFKLKQDIGKDCLLQQLERDGLGLRKGEGYGRIAVNRQESFPDSYRKEKRLDEPEQHWVPHPSEVEIPQEIMDLLQNVVRTRCISRMQEDAMVIVGQLSKENIPGNSLLGRLRQFLSHDHPVGSLEQLREPAREKLEKGTINMSSILPKLSDNMTLYTLFQTALTQPQSLTRDLIERSVNELVEPGYPHMDQTLIEMLVKDDSTPLCKDFLDYLLTVLERKSRGKMASIQ